MNHLTQAIDFAVPQMGPTLVAEKSGSGPSSMWEYALDALGQGVAIFDRNLQLVASNNYFFQMFDYPPELCRPGTHLANFVRCDAQRGYLETSDPDAAVELELGQVKQGDGSASERTRPDGVRIRVNHRILPDGGVIHVCCEVGQSDTGNGKQVSSKPPALGTSLNTKEALEAMSDAFVYYDAEDRLVGCNQKYKDLYSSVAHMIMPGIRFEDLVRSAAEHGQIVLEDQSPEEYVQWRLSLRSQPTSQFEIRHQDGRWLRVSDRRSSHGGIVSIHTDVTELKERENALRGLSEELSQQNVLFEAALNNMIQGLCMFDNNQRLIVVNRRYLELYNFSPQVVKPGITLREIMEYSVAVGNYTQEDGERALAERPSQAAKRETDVLLQRLRDGRVIAVMHSPLPNGGSVATYEDVTHREQTEDTLREYAARLENSNRELQDFAFVASHDLQEPLRKIESFGDRLKARYGDSLDEDGHLYIERMHNAAGRMRRLITDLLSYSRITTQARPFEPVALEKIVQEVTSDLQIAIEESGATIEVGPMPIIEADATQMRQIFQNLFSNALKFKKKDVAPRLKVDGRIFEVECKNSEPIEMCELKITDNGIGFENKYADRIFAIFQRLHGKSEYEGTGIGLATCRKIIDRHRGMIEAKGTPGEGSTFTVTLPTKQVLSEQDQ